MDIPGNFDKLMQQAKKMQEKLQVAQEELANTEVQGESGAGLVKVHMNGRHDVSQVNIDPSLFSNKEEDKEILEDLIAAAVNDAVRKIESSTSNKMQGLAKGMKLPEGFKMPGDSNDNDNKGS